MKAENLSETRKGDFVLSERMLLNCYPVAEGWWEEWRDTWLLDPSATLTPDTHVNNAFLLIQANASSPFTSPDNATTELTTAEYLYVIAEDALYLVLNANTITNNKYSNTASKYTFDTAGYANITDITCVWKGFRAPLADVPDVEKLQVYKASAWENWLTSLSTSNTEYTKSLGTGAAYFYSLTWIRFGVYQSMQKTIGETCTINQTNDYAAIIITYGITVTTKNAGLQPAMINLVLDE